MKRKSMVALLVAAGFATVAYAATLTFSWMNATEYTDDSPIQATGPDAIKETVIEYGPCNADRTALASVHETMSFPPSTLTAVRDALPSGAWCARARHVTNAGQPGLWTEVLSTVKDPAVPKAPSNFSIN
jgi:hypothetical protein